MLSDRLLPADCLRVCVRASGLVHSGLQKLTGVPLTGQGEFSLSGINACSAERLPYDNPLTVFAHAPNLVNNWTWHVWGCPSQATNRWSCTWQ